MSVSLSNTTTPWQKCTIDLIKCFPYLWSPVLMCYNAIKSDFLLFVLCVYKWQRSFSLQKVQGEIPDVWDRRMNPAVDGSGERETWVLSMKVKAWKAWRIGHEAPKETDTEKKVANSLYKEHCIWFHISWQQWHCPVIVWGVDGSLRCYFSSQSRCH